MASDSAFAKAAKREIDGQIDLCAYEDAQMFFGRTYGYEPTPDEVQFCKNRLLGIIEGSRIRKRMPLAARVGFWLGYNWEELKAWWRR